MKSTVKQVLETLKYAVGESIFTDTKRFKAALLDIRIETDAKTIRNLLNIAICDMKAYSRLKTAFHNRNLFFVDNLVVEMSSYSKVEPAKAQIVIECIAELLRDAPNVIEFIDFRDGNIYKTVEIGNQVWMAENLNYKVNNSWCYDNAKANGGKYGRLYTWDAANVVCPAGWHLPTVHEWDELVATVGGSDVAGKKLKARYGWNGNNIGNNTDDYGFFALPGGCRRSDGNFCNLGNSGLWWTATEIGSDSVYYRYIYYNSDKLQAYYNDKNYGYSVRYIKD